MNLLEQMAKDDIQPSQISEIRVCYTKGITLRYEEKDGRFDLSVHHELVLDCPTCLWLSHDPDRHFTLSGITSIEWILKKYGKFRVFTELDGVIGYVLSADDDEWKDEEC